MDKTFTCRCSFKIDLERSVDVFAFLEENYPVPSLLKNFKTLPPEEQRCACCLLGTALAMLEEKKKEKKKWLGWFRKNRR